MTERGCGKKEPSKGENEEKQKPPDRKKNGKMMPSQQNEETVDDNLDGAPLNVEQALERLGATVEAMRKLAVAATAQLKLAKKLARRTERGRRTRAKPLDDGVERKPSGFARPSDLSDELCGFLGIASGTSLPRTEVTKMICKYIKERSLALEGNKRAVDFTNPASAALHALLQPEPGAHVTYFNLQRYLKPHIRRVEGEAGASTATSLTPTAVASGPAPTPTPTPAAPTPKVAAPPAVASARRRVAAA